jgi:hypothetical protein
VEREEEEEEEEEEDEEEEEEMVSFMSEESKIQNGESSVGVWDAMA